MTRSPTEDLVDPPAHEPPTTKEGWTAFIEQQPSRMEVLAPARLSALTPAERDAYDDARIAHHARLIIVATPTVDQIVNAGRRLVLLNRGTDTARRGLVVTGDSGTGKSTAIKQLGKHHELLARRRRTAPGPFLPVVYVTVPPAATPKVLAAEFARFLGLPLPRNLNQVNITNAVCDVLSQLGTDLVLVDEIHNLNLATRVGAEASDQLKYLAERLPATFVYAGIDVEHAGLFSGVRGRQIAGRFASIATTAFAYGTRTQREQWAALVSALEHALRLHQHRTGSLLRLAGYLHERTSGMIGSLSHLIRDAAIEAIFDGAERITKTALDRVVLDHAAEPPRRGAAASPARPRRMPAHTASSGAA
ncbi:ATP-binding protein [Micromonospora sp. WMMD1102]|uniref:ATP-binding protein n=1 Tax=Micromonospora sp. WMMD1102 TaxID=3016105 RepID=UPI002415768B|nr:ATP-binding protein [Micromonospora sp. WMMD1102]MDG4786228.1 ATP-binding protein [Micromonospora sp. WMMD1102]